MSDRDPQSTPWSRLSDFEKGLLFNRLIGRIDSRVREATDWRKYLGHVLVGSNATAAAATLAFAETAAKANINVFRACGEASISFLLGFIASIFFLMVVYLRARETLIAESTYLHQVIANGGEITWHENVFVQRLGPGKYAAAVVFALMAAVGFVVGAALVLMVLFAA